MLRSYLPVIVFAGLGVIVGGALVMLNSLVGPEPAEQGEVASRTSPACRPRSRAPSASASRFYLVAMLFILFDIEVVFLYPVGVILNGADSVFVLAEILIFVALLLVALIYVWRKGALDWK